MTKQEFVNAIASESGLSKVDTEKALKATTEAIKNALAKGDSVQLIGFGTFSISERAARTGRNPQTGKEIQIAAKKVAKFKPGKALDESIN
ncbi:HU family DNA-binding protein [Plebeiibacterium sediminum]|uniref:HU family DNA-binding protein n=1 Tax=Plebeiibacterium sediminum TaxID=2992112 RepID=A0AAE3M665_9BACT|nr:HU family DNA-binding protein [Plebeiobacterium sediminum]MCW3787991.1 HU family DNA-binding protein [Plebeiobacterium sediminum]